MKDRPLSAIQKQPRPKSPSLSGVAFAKLSLEPKCFFVHTLIKGFYDKFGFALIPLFCWQRLLSGRQIFHLLTRYPNAKKNDQELYMYGGVSSKDSSIHAGRYCKLNAMAEIFRLNGIMDPLYKFQVLTASGSFKIIPLFCAQADLKNFKVVVGDRGFYKRYTSQFE